MTTVIVSLRLMALAAFFVMIWPGYALLHLAGHGRHRWSAALFAGPAVTLALWIIALSGAAWASVPLRNIFGSVWIATLLLAALGVALRLSVNRRVAANAADTRQDRLRLWATAALLPLLHLGLCLLVAPSERLPAALSPVARSSVPGPRPRG